MRHIERLEKKPGAFRWRGEEVTRIEGFSDAVFGFAITLLVVSLEVPRSVADLMDLVRGLPAFALSFAFLVVIWHAHHLFFRRFDLQDNTTIVLNAILLFIVVFYIYPLKFLTGGMMLQLFGLTTRQSPAMQFQSGEAMRLMIIYSLGYFGIFFMFYLLYRHAYRLRDELELSPREVFETRESCQHQLIHVAVSGLSILIAAVGGDGHTALAGMIYFLLGPAFTVHGTVMGRRKRMLFDEVGER